MKFHHILVDEKGNRVLQDGGDVQFYGDSIQLGDQLIRLDLGPADVHIETALANFCTGFRQKGLVAPRVCLRVPVDKLSDQYWGWNPDDAYETAQSVNAAPEADVPEISPRPAKDNYSCKMYAISTFVRSEVVSNADSALRVRMAAVKRCMTVMALASELRKQGPLQNTANFDANLVKTMDATSVWFNTTGAGSIPVGSDPIKDIQDKMEASLAPVTHLVMNLTVKNAMSRHPNVQKYFQSKGGTPTVPTAEQLSQMFDLPPIIVAEGKIKNGSAYPYIWGNDVTLLHMPEGLPTGEDIVNMANFYWTGQGSTLAGRVAVDDGFMVRSYFDERRGPLGGEKIIVFCFEDEKIVTTKVGGLLKSVVAPF